MIQTKNKTVSILINVLKESLSIVYIIVIVIFIFASLGLGFLFLDSVNKKENKYDDWILMEEWERKEEKRLEEKSINISVWTPKIKKKEEKKRVE